MTLRLYDTMTRRKEALTPRDPKNVRMYVCGPTVYQRIHIGNARPLVVFDVLFRLLRHLHGERHVTYVRNITDIDDRIIEQVRKDGVNGDLNEAVRELTTRTAAGFAEDWRALGCLPPTHEPRATDYVLPRPDGRASMIELIQALIERGHAYAAEGHVLFSVPSFPDYGRLSGRNRDDQIAGARVEVAPYKRDPADFVLWKPSTPEQPGWDGPWGRGRPGWHLECSAMSEALLGPLPFDIHGGGQDLVFPHHENEIAQTRCAHGLPTMAGIWMHNGFVDMRGEKMSKSVGNVIRAHEALQVASDYPVRRGEVVRFWMLGTHYRQPLGFATEALAEAANSLNRFYLALQKVEVAAVDDGEASPDFLDALSDDLNTPAAIAYLHRTLDEMNLAFFQERDAERARELGRSLRAAGSLLGVLRHDAGEWLHGADAEPDIEGLIRARETARRARDFAEADRLRAVLAELNVRLEDRPDGTTDWRRA